VKRLRLFRRDEIVPLLDRVSRDARKLRNSLNMMITFGLKPSPYIIAGYYLGAVLNEQHGPKIRSYVSHLDILAGAAEAAGPASARRSWTPARHTKSCGIRPFCLSTAAGSPALGRQAHHLQVSSFLERLGWQPFACGERAPARATERIPTKEARQPSGSGRK